MSDIDLRLGRWQDVLADVECDALIVDAPYSDKTHSGHDGGTGLSGNSRPGTVNRSTGQVEKGWERRALNYDAWTNVDVDAFVNEWSPRTRGWLISLTDDVLAPVWTDALRRAGRYVFSPLACVESGSRVRLSGDGPAQWSVWCVVSRPATKEFFRWGALPGAYVVPAGSKAAGAARKSVVGGKPLWLMQSLVRDYTRPGDLVCDPCAGGGTTLLAAGIEGRRAIGAEMMPEHYEIARKRIDAGYVRSMVTYSAGKIVDDVDTRDVDRPLPGMEETV